MADTDSLYQKAAKIAGITGIGVTGLWLAVVVAWLIGGAFGAGRRVDPQKAGQFGDTFGVVNALFTGIALVGVAYALVLQRDEIATVKAEAKESEKARGKAEAALALQSALQTVSAKLAAASAITQAYKALNALDEQKGDFYEDTERFQMRKYSQLQEICWCEIVDLERASRNGVANKKDPYKMFLNQKSSKLLEESINEWDGWSHGRREQFLMETTVQVRLLSEQEATLGTTFGMHLCTEYKVWRTMLHEFPSSTEDPTNFKNQVFGALRSLDLISDEA